MMMLILSLLSVALAMPEKVYLTFDDGPDKKYTKEILNILDEANIKGTFFLIGNKIKKNESLVKEVVAKGHKIGGHSMDHNNLSKINFFKAKEQIINNMNIINSFQGSKIFRFPYGEDNKELSNFLKELGYKNIKWDIDSFDWKYKNSKKISISTIRKIKNNRSSPIILMHSLKEDSIKALKDIIFFIKENNIKTDIVE